jgi:hypothetical protein
VSKQHSQGPGPPLAVRVRPRSESALAGAGCQLEGPLACAERRRRQEPALLWTSPIAPECKHPLLTEWGHRHTLTGLAVAVDSELETLARGVCGWVFLAPLSSLPPAASSSESSTPLVTTTILAPAVACSKLRVRFPRRGTPSACGVCDLLPVGCGKFRAFWRGNDLGQFYW